MSDSVIAATTRTEFGKGAARRTRRAGLVPAVLYGHGTDPIHLSLPGHEITLALRVANAVLELAIDGKGKQLALAKQVQRNPVKGTVEHIDLVIVKKGEKVHVEVPLLVVGTQTSDGVVIMDQQTITLEVEATHIPGDIEIDVTGLEVGAAITAGDLTLPKGAVFPGEASDLILSIAAHRAAAAADESAAEETEAAAAE